MDNTNEIRIPLESEVYDDMRTQVFPGPNPQAVVLADSRASSLLIEQTLDAHLPKDTTVYFDLKTDLGKKQIAHRLENGQKVGIVTFGDVKGETIPVSMADLPTINFDHLDATELAELDARIILVPAMIGSGEIFIDATQEGMVIDFGPKTVSGRIVDAVQESNSMMVMLDPPERGLVQFPKNKANEEVYARRFLVVGFDPGTQFNETDVVDAEIIED